ncbi:excalibur domain protein [Bacillus anthracis]|nr:excalibur domain protein [Bacillus anthracis]MZF33419.1 hypothetical protein [Bacillus anthracis]
MLDATCLLVAVVFSEVGFEILDNAPKITNKIAVIINCFFATPVFLITDKIASTRKKTNKTKLKIEKNSTIGLLAVSALVIINTIEIIKRITAGRPYCFAFPFFLKNEMIHRIKRIKAIKNKAVPILLKIAISIPPFVRFSLLII